MEESVNEVEVQESFRSPPRRRRSTFFERRESFAPPPILENQVKINNFKTESDEDKRQAELIRYYEKLLLEKEQWKKEVKQRKNKYDDLRQEFQMAVKASSSSRMSYSALTKEDIEFINAKPNISKLTDTQSSLHKATRQLQALYRRITELENVILNDCEAKMNKITEYILENSTVNPTQSHSKSIEES